MENMLLRVRSKHRSGDQLLQYSPETSMFSTFSGSGFLLIQLMTFSYAIPSNIPDDSFPFRLELSVRSFNHLHFGEPSIKLLAFCAHSLNTWPIDFLRFMQYPLYCFYALHDIAEELIFNALGRFVI